MRTTIALAAMLGLGLAAAAPAWAESTTANTATQGSQASANAAPSTPMLQQKIRSDLEKAGFKNIQVAPQAFAVHATNSDGQPVFMLISPDQVTAITTASNNAANSSKTGTTEYGHAGKMQ